MVLGLAITSVELAFKAALALHTLVFGTQKDRKEKHSSKPAVPSPLPFLLPSSEGYEPGSLMHP